MLRPAPFSSICLTPTVPFPFYFKAVKSNHVLTYIVPIPALSSLTGACALYLHCVALLKDMLQRMIPLINTKHRPNPLSGSPDSLQQAANQNQIVLERLQQVREFLWLCMRMCNMT
jgi:hypothetical protein